MSELEIGLTHNGTQYVCEVATIEYTALGWEDHGIFAVQLGFQTGAWHQGSGSWCLDQPVKDDDGKFLRREGTAYGMAHIMEIIRVLGCETWEKVKGQQCLVLRERAFGDIKGMADLHAERVLVWREHFEQWQAEHPEPVAVPS